jgi:hypothetical protein
VGFASAVLGPAGIRTLYGSADPGLPVVAAGEDIAGVLARAHRAVHHFPAASVDSGGTILVPGQTDGYPDTVMVTDCRGRVELVERIRAAARGSGIRVQMLVDPARPWDTVGFPAGTDAWLEDPDPWAERIAEADRVMVLAGPGVVAARAVPGLHALARTLNVGVVNTWGAKGVFHWRSRHHWATVGLQRDDFELAGMGEADLILVVGVDDREAPREAWAGRSHLQLPPEALDPLAERSAPKPVELDLPPLRSRLAAVTQAGWQSTGAPLAPSRVTMHYGQHLAGGGLVAAGAGTCGFWVARTLATTELGLVAVPAEVDPGWAAACVAVARLADPLRPALAVVDDPVDEATASVLDFAAGRGISIGVEVWGPSGESLSAEAHERRVGELAAAIPELNAKGATLRTDESQLEEFVAVAGPVRVWKPRPLREA